MRTMRERRVPSSDPGWAERALAAMEAAGSASSNRASWAKVLCSEDQEKQQAGDVPDAVQAPGRRPADALVGPPSVVWLLHVAADEGRTSCDDTAAAIP